MRVFYSHPMKLYGTDAERREIALIEKRFVGCEIVDPSALESGAAPGRETEYYLSLVDSCEYLVFSRLFGYITEGVKPEVEHALSNGKGVYELRDGRFIPVTGPVANLPIMERLFLRARNLLGAASRGPKDLSGGNPGGG
jgi:hypothetical protein